MIPVFFFFDEIALPQLILVINAPRRIFFQLFKTVRNCSTKKECPYAFLSTPEQKMDILLNEHQLIEITQHTQYLRK